MKIISRLHFFYCPQYIAVLRTAFRLSARRGRVGGRRSVLGLWLLLALLCGAGCSHSGATAPTGAATSVPPGTVAGNPIPSEAPQGLFADRAQSAGVNFTLGHGGRSPLTILDTLGGGCALLDYDGDGWLDLLLVGPHKVALYHNKGNGTFEDITAQSGLDASGYWQGVAVGDYDNDGKPDIYLSGYRCAALYHNESRGQDAPPASGLRPPADAPSPVFRDVTKQAHLGSALWGTSAAFVDVDNDGFLDLYVCHYVKFGPSSNQFCNQGGIASTCGPTNYDPEKGTLYHNNGHGGFTDETAKRGLADAHGNALGVAIADYDGDGWPDIAIANDQLPGDLYRNKGRGFFENVGLLSGTAYDGAGSAHAGMGIDWADYNTDGNLELVVTTYQHQATSLYAQSTPGLFSDITNTAGTGVPSINYVKFGVKFFDYDNDGQADLVVTNGHAVDNIAKTDSTTTYPQIPQLFHNVGDGKMKEVTKEAGAAFAHPVVGRGLAVGDYDNDGKPDVVIVDIEGHALLLHNETPTPNHWLTLRLQGTNSNRDGIGATLLVEANGRKWRQVVSATGSFLAASDLRPHLGLGTARQAERIEIRWPSGTRTVLNHVAGDRIVAVSEATGIVEGASAMPGRGGKQ